MRVMPAYVPVWPHPRDSQFIDDQHVAVRQLTELNAAQSSRVVMAAQVEPIQLQDLG